MYEPLEDQDTTTPFASAWHSPSTTNQFEADSNLDEEGAKLAARPKDDSASDCKNDTPASATNQIEHQSKIVAGMENDIASHHKKFS